MLVAPRVGGIKVKGGTLEADGQLAGTPSVLLDAVALIVTTERAEKLCSDGAAVQFVMDAFAHLKTIGSDDNASALTDIPHMNRQPDHRLRYFGIADNTQP